MSCRVIIAIPAESCSPPAGAILANGHIDYVTQETPPADALYIAQMDELGQVSIVKPAPEGFVHEHTFAGWPPVYRLG